MLVVIIYNELNASDLSSIEESVLHINAGLKPNRSPLAVVTQLQVRCYSVHWFMNWRFRLTRSYFHIFMICKQIGSYFYTFTGGFIIIIFGLVFLCLALSASEGAYSGEVKKGKEYEGTAWLTDASLKKWLVNYAPCFQGDVYEEN